MRTSSGCPESLSPGMLCSFPWGPSLSIGPLVVQDGSRPSRTATLFRSVPAGKASGRNCHWPTRFQRGENSIISLCWIDSVVFPSLSVSSPTLSAPQPRSSVVSPTLSARQPIKSVVFPTSPARQPRSFAASPRSSAVPPTSCAVPPSASTRQPIKSVIFLTSPARRPSSSAVGATQRAGAPRLPNRPQRGLWVCQRDRVLITERSEHYRARLASATLSSRTGRAPPAAWRPRGMAETARDPPGPARRLPGCDRAHTLRRARPTRVCLPEG
jgi:hypothetical protein